MPRPDRRVPLLGGDADHNIGHRAILAAAEAAHAAVFDKRREHLTETVDA